MAGRVLSALVTLGVALSTPLLMTAAPELTVTVPEQSYVDGGPVRATVKIAGSDKGSVTFSRASKQDCSGEVQKIGTVAHNGGEVKSPDLNELKLGRYGLYVFYQSSLGQNVNKCVPYAILRRSHVLGTLARQQFGIGEKIEPAVSLGVAPGAGGKVEFVRYATDSCTGPGTVVGASAVVNGQVTAKQDLQDGKLGVHAYRLMYTGDQHNSAESSACRPYAVGAFVRGTVFRDLNSNGVFDPGEPGVAGVKLTLSRDGSTVDSVNAAVNGAYEFFVIAMGRYTITETQPEGYGSSTPDQIAVEINGQSLGDKNFGDTVTLPSASPSASESPSPPVDRSMPPLPSPAPEPKSAMSPVLWIGIALVLLATVMLLVLVAAARNRQL